MDEERLDGCTDEYAGFHIVINDVIFLGINDDDVLYRA